MTTISIPTLRPARATRRRFNNSPRAWLLRAIVLVCAAAAIPVTCTATRYSTPHCLPDPASPITYTAGTPDPTYGQHGTWLAVTVAEADSPVTAALLRTHLPLVGHLAREAKPTGADAATYTDSVVTAWAVADHLATGAPINAGLIVSPIPAINPSFATGAQLRDGDILVSIGGIKTPTADQLPAVVTTYGGTVQPVTILRGDRLITTTATVPTGAVTGLRWGFGPGDTAGAAVPAFLPQAGGFSGPSAGLINTLAYIDALTPGDLAGGMAVAATGTITPDGTVGEIDGAAEKIRGAQPQHPDVFFAPAAYSAGEAAAAGTPTLVVPVRNVQDAITWLCAHGGTSTVCPGGQVVG